MTHVCAGYTSEVLCRFKPHATLLSYTCEWILPLLIKNTQQDSQTQLPQLLFHFYALKKAPWFSKGEFS